jgi:hypothetical protein
MPETSPGMGISRQQHQGEKAFVLRQFPAPRSQISISKSHGMLIEANRQ